MRWRWDQGRLDYFKFDNLSEIARVLCQLDGVMLNSSFDLLREPLETATELPFSPSHYKVWRNYARVFQCAMLATGANGKLVVSDVCKKLGNKPSLLTSDQYLNFVFSHFTLPFPAFDDYAPSAPVTYPFVAIVKFLISRPNMGASLADVFSYVIGNQCTGLEDVGHYLKLKPQQRRPIGDEERQVREMLVFMGQSSFLKWFDRNLFLDSSDVSGILKAIAPSVRENRKSIVAEEFLAMTSTGSETSRKKLEISLADRGVSAMGFKEGMREFGSHGKLERSPLVRKYYFIAHPELICDACSVNTKVRYPWTDNILELHHLLPLSATLNVNGTTTLLEDLVPLCPSCHKSIHAYYRLKLREWGVADFGSKKMAKDVYKMAKMEIVC